MDIILPPHRKTSQPVTEVSKALMDVINDMKFTLKQQKFVNGRKGYAIAHSQVSQEPYRVFVVSPGLMKHEIIINPKILEKDEKMTHLEGCLSFPFRPNKNVSRYRTLTVQYQDENMKVWHSALENIPAFIFQHEIDHMNGIDIYGKK
jgi:peptide deformylase